MDKGIYLVTSYEDDFLPFLIQIPLRMEGTLTYDVEASPKQDEPNPTVPSSPSGTDAADAPGTDSTDMKIPQTGNSVIPMYVLLILGTVLTLAGLYELIQGRKEHYE